MRKIQLAYGSLCVSLFSFTPLVVFAAPQNFSELIRLFTRWVDRGVIPVLVALAFVTFLYGIFNYFILKGDYSKKETYRDVLLYGLIGLVVMLSFWGLVALVKNSLFQ